jgi:hypothetical protein
VVHAAYWKYAVRRRLTGEKRGSFPLHGSNFWIRPEEDSDAAWKRDVELLASEHRALRAAIVALAAGRFTQQVPGSPVTYASLIRGVAAHDLYHAGQIQLLKRLTQS